MKSISLITDEINDETGNKNVVVLKLDLSSFASIREFAAEVIKTERKIDVLVHNAGISEIFKRKISVDGIELTMATNHYGPFLLTHLLINLMKRSENCRIVIVTSMVHAVSMLNPLNADSLNPVNFFPPFQLYVNSKMANVMFCYELARRLKGTKITVNCLHPGATNTRIFAAYPFPFSMFMMFAKHFFKTPVQGSQTTNYVAVSPDLNGISGKYFVECKEIESSQGSYNMEYQKALWKASKKLVKLSVNDPKI